MITGSFQTKMVFLAEWFRGLCLQRLPSRSQKAMNLPGSSRCDCRHWKRRPTRIVGHHLPRLAFTSAPGPGFHGLLTHEGYPAAFRQCPLHHSAKRPFLHELNESHLRFGTTPGGSLCVRGGDPPRLAGEESWN